MKIKENGGRVVHSQLTFAFSMIELGGSAPQKYNTLSGEYIPDRFVTPYALKPSLDVSDPDGNYPAGTYTSYLANVRWVVKEYFLGSVSYLVRDADWTYNETTQTFLLYRNTRTDHSIKISFSADFLNKYSGEVSTFTWEKTLTVLPEKIYNLKLTVDHPKKVLLYPFKNRGQFEITANLHNADIPITAHYWWFYLNDNKKAWLQITGDEPWYVSGKESGILKVDQDFIDELHLKVEAWPNNDMNIRKTETLALFGLSDKKRPVFMLFCF